MQSPPTLSRAAPGSTGAAAGILATPAQAWICCKRWTNAGAVRPVDLVINLDGFNPVTQVLASWLRPEFIAGGALTSDLRNSFPWGDLPQQRFLEEADWDSTAFLRATQQLAQQQRHIRIVLPYGPDRNRRTCNSPQQYCTAFQRARCADSPHHCRLRREGVAVRALAQGDRRLQPPRLQCGLPSAVPPKFNRRPTTLVTAKTGCWRTTDLIDLRGQTTPMELAACRQTAAVVSVDAGPMHIAAAVGTPTLALVGMMRTAQVSLIRLWLPRTSNLSRTVSPHSCDQCASNRFRNDGCLVEGHPCMRDVLPEQVIDGSPVCPACKNGGMRADDDPLPLAALASGTGRWTRRSTAAQPLEESRTGARCQRPRERQPHSALATNQPPEFVVPPIALRMGGRLHPLLKVAQLSAAFLRRRQPDGQLVVQLHDEDPGPGSLRMDAPRHAAKPQNGVIPDAYCLGSHGFLLLRQQLVKHPYRHGRSVKPIACWRGASTDSKQITLTTLGKVGAISSAN